jgi:putative SOS response-associated peptidase YedK
MRAVDAASDLLKPYDARLMRCYPVSTRINSVAHDDAAPLLFSLVRALMTN